MAEKQDIHFFFKLLETARKKNIMKTARRLANFEKIEITFAFLQALVMILPKIKGEKKKEKELHQALTTIKRGFVNLPIEQIEKILLFYYYEYIPVNNTAPFDIVTVLGGCKVRDGDFAIKIFDKILSVMERCAVPATEEEKKIRNAALNFLVGIISMTGVLHTWPCLAANLKNKKCQEIFEDVIKFIFLSATRLREIKLVPVKFWQAPLATDQALLSQRLNSIGFDGNSLKLPIPWQNISKAQEIAKKIIADQAMRQIDLFDLAMQVREKKETINTILEKKWQEIIHKPKYAILSGGCDYVRVEIEALKKAGYYKIQFVKEGLEYPAVNALLWFKLGSRNCKLKITLEPKKIEDYIAQADLNCELGLIDMLLASVAIHCYWSIITGEAFQNHSQKENKGKPGITILTPRPRRPKLVKLPAGYKASPEAVQRCLDVFKDIPPLGHTFRKEHMWPKTKIEIEGATLAGPLFTLNNMPLDY